MLQSQKAVRKRLFGFSDEFEEFLGICCIKISSKKSKGPKLLLNQLVHSLQINAVQTNSSYKQCYVHAKDVVCTVLGKPCYEGSSRHRNRKISQTKSWRILLDSGSNGDVLFVKKGSKQISYTK